MQVHSRQRHAHPALPLLGDGSPPPGRSAMRLAPCSASSSSCTRRTAPRCRCQQEQRRTWVICTSGRSTAQPARRRRRHRPPHLRGLPAAPPVALRCRMSALLRWRRTAGRTATRRGPSRGRMAATTCCNGTATATSRWICRCGRQASRGRPSWTSPPCCRCAGCCLLSVLPAGAVFLCR